MAVGYGSIVVAVMFCCFSLLLTSFLYASRGNGQFPVGQFYVDKLVFWGYNGGKSSNFIRREGDRAAYRLFALYGEFDKAVWVWYNVKK